MPLDTNAPSPESSATVPRAAPAADPPRGGISASIGQIRARFPALSRCQDSRPVVYLDGPAGSQVPVSVVAAIQHYMVTCNANHGGNFATSRESDALLEQVHAGMADFLGAPDPECVYFGPNMTTLTFALSRSLARGWKAGDEIIVTRLDHDANVTPWVLAARDAGAKVHYLGFHHRDCTLDMEQFQRLLSPRTRLVAVGCASNAVGTVNPVRQMAELAHARGALVFLDAVHFAPHRLIDVQQLGGDFLCCSAYKFFGPHIGAMWGRRELLEQLTAYKVRPASDELPHKWMTGTQNHACLAGTLAAVEYFATLGRELTQQPALARRDAIASALRSIEQYECTLLDRLLDGLASIPTLRVWGITDPHRRTERLPTLAVTHRDLPASQIAHRLGEQGIFVWHGNYYALQLTETLGLEPEGMVRIGMLHYNTIQEVDRLLEQLSGM